MKLDLVAAWRSAVADGQLPEHHFLFGKFVPWLKDNLIEPESLDRARYELFFAEQALAGLGVRNIAFWDIYIRRYYRWAALEGIIANVPFGDRPMSSVPPPQTSTISEFELQQVLDHLISVALDTTNYMKVRLKGACAALLTALAYYAGASARELMQLPASSITLMVAVCDRRNIPENFKRAIQAYVSVKNDLPTNETEMLFYTLRGDEIERNSRSANGKPLTHFLPKTSGSYVGPIGVAASKVGLPHPERFTALEILRLRSAHLHRMQDLKLPGIKDLSRTPPRRTITSWTVEDIRGLSKLHPLAKRHS